jgi:hypothetical protein
MRSATVRTRRRSSYVAPVGETSVTTPGREAAAPVVVFESQRGG